MIVERNISGAYKMIVERNISGAYKISAFINGRILTRVYYDYTHAEAVRAFKDAVKDERAAVITANAPSDIR